jgi:hypothetical protein
VRANPVPPTLVFVRVPEDKAVKNRVHLDVSPVDQGRDEEVDRLLALGARHVDIGQGEQSWVVLADPEANDPEGPSMLYDWNRLSISCRTVLRTAARREASFR